MTEKPDKDGYYDPKYQLGEVIQTRHGLGRVCGYTIEEDGELLYQVRVNHKLRLYRVNDDNKEVKP